MMMNAIDFNHVSKKFTLHKDKRNTVQERIASIFQPRAKGEEFWALRDVSFNVAPGQSLGLVGHNGAGKSTALKLVTRILEPTSGTVQISGRVAALLELGSGFHPDLSGRENVFLNGALMGYSRHQMQERMEEIIAFSEIGDFIDMEVKHYSSGMYTRLAFAVATSVDPDVLITDEVLAVGDESFQRKCMERIYQFRRMGKTIVFVSHALETVRALCDIAVWLDHGVAKAVGPAGEVIDAYLDDVNRQEREKLAKQGNSISEVEQKLRRHGNREVELVDVELLDSEGNPQPTFRTGSSLTIRMHYHAKRQIERPVFGIGLHHESGFWLLGPNTRFDGLPIPSVQGDGVVDYVIPDLPLLAGRYLVSATVYDQALLHPYDAHDRLYPLVIQGDGRERFGALAVDGSWKWTTES